MTGKVRSSVWRFALPAILVGVPAYLTHTLDGRSHGDLVSVAAAASPDGDTTDRDPPARDPASPDTQVHPAIAGPADISPERAEEIYQAIRGRLRDQYAQSGDPLFVAYQDWKRFTRLPYRAGSHGERFVHHYANETAEKYGEYEEAGVLPVGSIIIKDSFVVTKLGQVINGPLFLMEKMPEGFRSAAGTWRFMMLRDDGSIVGLTGGTNENAVKFCAECHAKAEARQDFLYFMPEEARLKQIGPDETKSSNPAR